MLFVSKYEMRVETGPEWAVSMWNESCSCIQRHYGPVLSVILASIRAIEEPFLPKAVS